MREQKSFILTLLAAAVVEALPDRAKAKRIQRAFQKSGKCPTSLIFPTPEAVQAFYAQQRKKR